MLARALETAGLATVGLSIVREQAERIRAPRFLHCEFPLGRPLGRPGDAVFQLDVIRRALGLLERTDVPVLVDHPEVIEDAAEQPEVCALPPRHDPRLHPAVDEALALIPAYRRQVAAVGGRTAFGRVTTIEELGSMVERFVALADGAPLDELGFDADTVRAAGQDLRAFYEEAGLALAEHVPAARRLESWFYRDTATGPLVKAAAEHLKAAGVERSTWYYLLPGTQQ